MHKAAHTATAGTRDGNAGVQEAGGLCVQQPRVSLPAGAPAPVRPCSIAGWGGVAPHSQAATSVAASLCTRKCLSQHDPYMHATCMGACTTQAKAGTLDHAPTAQLCTMAPYGAGCPPPGHQQAAAAWCSMFEAGRNELQHRSPRWCARQGSVCLVSVSEAQGVRLLQLRHVGLMQRLRRHLPAALQRADAWWCCSACVHARTATRSTCQSGSAVQPSTRALPDPMTR